MAYIHGVTGRWQMNSESDAKKIAYLERLVEALEYRIDRLRGCLYDIENVDRYDEDLPPWWAKQALEDDNAAVKEWENERQL